MTRLAVTLFLLLPQLASAKRTAPANVAPVIYQGIRYVAPNDDGRRGYIEAWNVGTNKKLWELTIFTNGIDPNLEEDVQWVFIKALNIQDGRLMVTSERSRTYQVDVNTKAIAQSESVSSPSPGAIRDIPDAVKHALTNGSSGKEYDLFSRINPSYLKGDFNGDGKMDVAALVKLNLIGDRLTTKSAWKFLLAREVWLPYHAELGSDLLSANHSVCAGREERRSPLHRAAACPLHPLH